MLVKMTKKEAVSLFRLHDSVEFANDKNGKPTLVPSKFRYSLNYNIQKLSSITNNAAKVLEIESEIKKNWDAYEMRLRELASLLTPKENIPALSTEEKKKFEDELKELPTKYKKSIEAVTAAKAIYNKKLEEPVEVELRMFYMSQFPDLSSNSVNDGFMYTTMNLGLLINDVDPSPSDLSTPPKVENKNDSKSATPKESNPVPAPKLDTKPASQSLSPTGILSEESIGNVGG